MGNMVADAMREKYPDVDAAVTNSGGLRADLVMSPPSAGEAVGEITWGEMFAVLPFGNRTVIETLTGAQLTEALTNGFSPVCDPAIATGRFPQVSGLKLTFHCSGTTRGRRQHRQGAGRSGRNADPRRADGHRPPGDQRLHVHRRGRLHRLRRRHRRAATRRRSARRRDRVGHRPLAGRADGGGSDRQGLSLTCQPAVRRRWIVAPEEVEGHRVEQAGCSAGGSWPAFGRTHRSAFRSRCRNLSARSTGIVAVTVAVDEQNRCFDAGQFLLGRKVCIVRVRPHGDEVPGQRSPVVVALVGMPRRELDEGRRGLAVRSGSAEERLGERIDRESAIRATQIVRPEVGARR